MKLAFLLIQCLECALPYGGVIRVDHMDGKWLLHGKAERMKIEPPVWEMLVTPGKGRDVSPAQVQLVLVPDTARRLKRRVQTELKPDEITLVF